MASIYWKGTDGAYSTNANWSGGAIPTAGDNVRLIAEYDGDISTGLNQSAVAIGEFIVDEGYDGNIGSIAGYLRIDPDFLSYAGGGISYLDIGSANIQCVIEKTGSVGSGERALYIKGSNIATLAVQSGSVALAGIQGDTATAVAVNTISDQADVLIGTGTTIGIGGVICQGGVIRCRASAGLIEIYSGTVYLEEDAVATVVNIYGGRFVMNGITTATTINAYGGTLDWMQSAAPRQVADINIYPGATLLYNPACVSYTNPPVFMRTMQVSTSQTG